MSATPKWAGVAELLMKAKTPKKTSVQGVVDLGDVDIIQRRGHVRRSKDGKVTTVKPHMVVRRSDIRKTLREATDDEIQREVDERQRDRAAVQDNVKPHAEETSGDGDAASHGEQAGRHAPPAARGQSSVPQLADTAVSSGNGGAAGHGEQASTAPPAARGQSADNDVQSNASPHSGTGGNGEASTTGSQLNALLGRFTQISHKGGAAVSSDTAPRSSDAPPQEGAEEKERQRRHAASLKRIGALAARRSAPKPVVPPPSLGDRAMGTIRDAKKPAQSNSRQEQYDTDFRAAQKAYYEGGGEDAASLDDWMGTYFADYLKEKYGSSDYYSDMKR